MTKRTRKKARATVRNARRAEVNAQKSGEVVEFRPKLPKDREKTGLEWLVFKRRISARQAQAGRRYGDDWRIAQTAGMVPLRSCLNDSPGGSSNAARALPSVEHHLDACERLGAAQAALSYQADMISALAAICGRQLTPWQAVELAGGTARDVAKLEVVLGIALDLLDKHYRGA
jgi:hypothetical protein